MFELFFKINKFKTNKIFKLIIFFSFIFNILASNGYSYMLFIQAVNQIQTTTIFTIDNNPIILAKIVKKDVKDMLNFNVEILNIRGLIENLSKKDTTNPVDTKKIELKTDKSNNLVFCIIEHFYIFSMSDLVFDLKRQNKKDFISRITGQNILKNFEIRIKLHILKIKKIFYDLIKHFFLHQNVENHAKIYLDSFNNFNIFNILNMQKYANL